MKKLFLKHITSYTYLNPVVESSNKILLYPYNDINQQVVSHEIEISENPKIFTYLDNFNNRVGFFSYSLPHKKLVITSSAEIIKKKNEFPLSKLSANDQWTFYSKNDLNPNYIAFLRSKKFKFESEALWVISDLKAKNDSPLELLLKLCNYIYNNFKYKKGVTDIYTSLDKVWEIKSGVCQDFANVLIKLCNIIQIPARYVSGYIFTEKKYRGYNATHAWVEALIPGYGWVGLDPTNNIISNENHIKLAVGRNYNDCSPVKGFFKGNEKQEMEVKVFVDTKKNTDNYDFHYDENLNNKIESNDDENVDFQNSYRKRLEVIQQQQQQQQ